MIFKKCLSFFIVLSTLSVAARADVAPEPGEMRVNPHLVFELQEDFADYRFFLESPIDVEEIQVKKGEAKNIDDTNRGGAKRFVTLIAIPKNDLDKLGVNLSEGENTSTPEKLKQIVKSRALQGKVELIKHSFQQDIPISKRAAWSYPVYRIERSGNSLQAVETGSISPKLSAEEESRMDAGRLGRATIAAGTLIGLTVLLSGIWFIRRNRRKAV